MVRSVVRIFDLNVPIYDAVKKYTGSDPAVFHMPGHKLGKGIPSSYLGDWSLLDVTEIPGTDNLHFPEGPVKEAQELAAQAFGSDRTFFLVNGSTCGIHAMIATICLPGDELIVARDCHKSVIGGMMLSGIRPVYLAPEYNESFGIPASVTPKAVEEALCRHPRAVGVLITRPNYYGICGDIGEIARIVHRYGKILAVDEAHGSHLRFSRRLPACAMDSGADICVQSAHKTLPALTQSAYLHVRGSRVDIERLSFNLRLLQTSSPSYIMMAFLDIARAVMERDGENLIGRLLDGIEVFIEDIGREFEILGKKLLPGEEMDTTRIVASCRGIGRSGYETERLLREHFNLQVEMSDLFNIVCISTVSDTAESLERLGNALRGMGKMFSKMPGHDDINYTIPLISEREMELWEVWKRQTARMPLKDAVGKISADIITPYPPGIPVVCPGEIISGETADHIMKVHRAGGRINGLYEDMSVRIVL